MWANGSGCVAIQDVYPEPVDVVGGLAVAGDGAEEGVAADGGAGGLRVAVRGGDGDGARGKCPHPLLHTLHAGCHSPTAHGLQGARKRRDTIEMLCVPVVLLPISVGTPLLAQCKLVHMDFSCLAPT